MIDDGDEDDEVEDGDDDDGYLGSGSVNARATVQLADPKVNQPAEYELTRGPLEYGGTWAPYGCTAFGCDSCCQSGSTERGSETF